MSSSTYHVKENLQEKSCSFFSFSLFKKCLAASQILQQDTRSEGGWVGGDPGIRSTVLFHQREKNNKNELNPVQIVPNKRVSYRWSVNESTCAVCAVRDRRERERQRKCVSWDRGGVNVWLRMRRVQTLTHTHAHTLSLRCWVAASPGGKDLYSSANQRVECLCLISAQVNGMDGWFSIQYRRSCAIQEINAD